MDAMHCRFNRLFILFCLSLFLCGPVFAAEEPGKGFFDKGMFDFEAGLYDEAIVSFDKALNAAPDNPAYNHYIGKAYMQNKLPAKAEVHLKRAYAIDPDRMNLRYDLGLVYFMLSQYGPAAEYFEQVTDREPGNIPAAYYAGVCYYRSGQESSAIEKFQYVKANTQDAKLRSDAEKWLARIQATGVESRPYSLYLKAGVQYDDFTRLDPLETDLLTGAEYDTDKTEEDLVYVGFFSGRYNVINQDRLVMGAAYSHYQTWHQDLDQYDLVGSVGNLFSYYRTEPFVFAFSYIPSFYLLDEDSYLRRHLFRPEIIWQINPTIAARLTYHYYTNHYFDDAYKNGYANEIIPSVAYMFPSGIGNVSLGAGYEMNSADHPDEDYDQWTIRVESLLNMPLSIKLRLIAMYVDKQYDNTNSYYGKAREDAKYSGTVSMARSIYRDLLDVQAEFNYTENDSRINPYDYRRTTSTLALVLTY